MTREQLIEHAAALIRRGRTPTEAARKLASEGVEPWTAFLCARAGWILNRGRRRSPLQQNRV